MAKVFFISDLHFGHKDVIAFDHRPFKDVEEMDAEMIRKWNAKVSHDDHVFVIGDMFGGVTTAHAGEIVRSLNGKIHLIRGNHDPRGQIFESLFEDVALYRQIQVRVRGVRQRVIMLPFHAFNVGACRLDYEPKTLEEILEKAGEIRQSK